jgi:pimeloyl-ACP methyl ester carboxylesterase
MRALRAPVLTALLALLLSGCAEVEPPVVETVSLTAPDGVVIEADLHGEGVTGLVLAHGMHYVEGKDTFRRELLFFGERGVRVLALSFRGYPASSTPPLDPDRTLDLVAGVRRLREEGCERIYVLGSSMGSVLALAAAPLLLEEPGFAGLVLVSGGAEGAADALPCRKLLVWAKDDPGVAERMESMYRTAAEPKDFMSFEKGGHGQRLFEASGGPLRRTILAFLREEKTGD